MDNSAEVGQGFGGQAPAPVNGAPVNDRVEALHFSTSDDAPAERGSIVAAKRIADLVSWSASGARDPQSPFEALANSLNNAGFEGGHDGWWTEDSYQGGNHYSSDIIYNGSANSGSWSAYLCGYTVVDTDTLSQTVALPAVPIFAFYLRGVSNGSDNLQMVINGTTVATFDSTNTPSSYTQQTIDLTAWAGTTVTLSFVGTQSYTGSFWLLDDVTLSGAGVGASSSATPGHLIDYGGPVLPHVKIFTIYWNSSVYGQGALATGALNIPSFYATITGSSYFDWLSEYRGIGRGSYLGSYVDTGAPTGSALTDAQIQTELKRLVTGGLVPAPDVTNGTVYTIYFPHGVSITGSDGSKSCASGGFCAYHGDVKNGSARYYYSVIPDNGAGSGCDTGCGTGTRFGNLTSVSSHEMIEAVTDAQVADSTTLSSPLAWYDNTNGEIGDICNAVQGSLCGYTVQKEWSNSQNVCQATAPGATVVCGSVSGSTCSSPSTSCSGSCVNLNSDVNNCGACGNACGTGSSCSSGSCVSSSCVTGTQRLSNTGFESGASSGWTSTNTGVSHAVISSSGSYTAHAGSWYARLGGNNSTSDTISQTVSLTANTCSAPKLSFYISITSTETTTTSANDTLIVTVGGTTIATLSNLQKGSGYTLKSYTLPTSLEGNAGAVVKFAVKTNSSYVTTFLVDDVTIQ